MASRPTPLTMRIHSITQEALRIKSYDLRPLQDSPLPVFTAGAHIDLLLPIGVARSYSLISPPQDRNRYVVAISRDDAGRGGSRFIHDDLSVGDVLEVFPPRNLFELNEDAAHSVLIAGGIGITPIFCMLHRLNELKRSWHLVYCARSPAQAAFLDRISALAGDTGRVDLHFNEEPDYIKPDFHQLVTDAPPNTHFYGCGPAPLLDAFDNATAILPQSHVHTECFLPVSTEGNELGGFTVVLAHSGMELYVPPGETILKTVRNADIDVVSLCEEGTCGSCETAVLDGIPHHRDHVLSDEDKADGGTIMICCSGSKTERLTLDL